MPKYTEHFHLAPDEIDLIEQALRREISVTNKQSGAHAENHETTHERVRDLNSLLGKLYNQKKFYSQVNNTGVPAG